MAALIRLGTVSLVVMVPKVDTALTLPFSFCHGIVPTSLCLRYVLLNTHNKRNPMIQLPDLCQPCLTESIASVVQ